MRIIIFVLIIIAIPALAQSATLKVPSQYPTIQDAIDAASGGDTVLVEPGTYVENIDFLGKAITVVSSDGPDIAIIDGSQIASVVTFQSGEGPGSVLDGFTLTNGSGNNDPSWGYVGGGVYCYQSSPVITRCLIKENRTACSGGGIFCGDNANPEISKNLIMNNSSGEEGDGGGGIFCFKSAPDISGNIISNNTAYGPSGPGISPAGGGIYLFYSNSSITNNVILENEALEGGGIYNTGSSPTVDNCTITNNYGGGGMCNYNSNPMVTNCTFSGNSAVVGGMENYNSSPTVTNCTFSGNFGWFGGGMYNDHYSTPTVTNCTFTGNFSDVGGGGMRNYGSGPTVMNCILWNDTRNEISGYATVTYCCVQGGYSGTGNIDSDPLFVENGYWDDNGTPSDPYDDFWVEGDYHLTFNSPCRGSGTNSAPYLPTTDFEGDPRIAYGTVDMGADEFYTHLYWTGDAIPGEAVKIKLVGLPGTSPVFLWVGSGVLDTPISTMYGDWYLDFPILLTLGLGPIVSPEGVSVLPYTLDPLFPVMNIPMQSLIGIELTNHSVMEVTK